MSSNCFSYPWPVIKCKRTSLTLELKLEILRRSDAGEGSSALGRHYNLGESTIRNIKKNAVAHSTPLSAKITTKIRNPQMEMEKMLSLYIEHETKKKSSLSNLTLRSKALKLFERVCQEDNVAESEPFQASKGWLNKFIKCQNLHNLKISVESASADHEAAAKFPDELKAVIEANGYHPKQVFNADETGLFWKRMPSRTYISKEEKVAPGFKVAKDRLTTTSTSSP